MQERGIGIAAILVTREDSGEEAREELDRIHVHAPSSENCEGTETDSQEGNCHRARAGRSGCATGIMVRVSQSALASALSDQLSSFLSPRDRTPHMAHIGLRWQETRVQGLGAWGCAHLCQEDPQCIASFQR